MQTGGDVAHASGHQSGPTTSTRTKAAEFQKATEYQNVLFSWDRVSVLVGF